MSVCSTTWDHFNEQISSQLLSVHSCCAAFKTTSFDIHLPILHIRFLHDCGPPTRDGQRNRRTRSNCAIIIYTLGWILPSCSLTRPPSFGPFIKSLLRCEYSDEWPGVQWVLFYCGNKVKRRVKIIQGKLCVHNTKKGNDLIWGSTEAVAPSFVHWMTKYFETKGDE